jgi:hypothetical protein
MTPKTTEKPTPEKAKRVAGGIATTDVVFSVNGVTA